jgi:hypothetical protein
MQQKLYLPKQDYRNWRAVASLADTLCAVVEPTATAIEDAHMKHCCKNNYSLIHITKRNCVKKGCQAERQHQEKYLSLQAALLQASEVMSKADKRTSTLCMNAHLCDSCQWVFGASLLTHENQCQVVTFCWERQSYPSKIYNLLMV